MLSRYFLGVRGHKTAVTKYQWCPELFIVLGCHEAVAEFVDNGIEASREQQVQAVDIHLFVASDDEKVLV